MAPRQIRDVRGNDITIIFQELMTSLNPLHTIESRSAKSCSASGSPIRRAGRIIELLTRSAFPIQVPPAELPAPAFRRATPARDDRDGARQRARSADR